MADKEISAITGGTDPKTALFHGVEGANSRKFTGAVLGHQFRGARARMTSDDTTMNVTTDTDIAFDVADFDTDSFWSAGSPTRLTIQVGKGIRYVNLTGQVRVNVRTPDTWFSAQIKHFNSAGTTLRMVTLRQLQGGTNDIALTTSTGPLAVADGDYFTLTIREESDTSVTIVGTGTVETFLSLHVIGMEPV